MTMVQRMVLFILGLSSRPSTAEMEARIQRRTWPAVGCADLFVAASNRWNGRPSGRLLGLHGAWRNESVLESRAKSPPLVGCRSCAVCPSHHPPKPVRAPDSPASPSGTTPNLRRENAPLVVETLSPWYSSWEMIASESDISHERLAVARQPMANSDNTNQL
jgi:hypothetical protein